MAKATLSATLPDGTKATRKTDAKYTHVVAVRRSYIGAVKRAQDHVKSPTFKGNYEYNVATVTLGVGAIRRSGSLSWTISQADVDRAIKAIGGATSFEEYAARFLAENLALIEKQRQEGHYSEWIDLRWSSRLELARSAASAALTGSMFEESRVVPVNA